MVNKAISMDPARDGAPQAATCIPVHNPATGECLAEVPIMGAAEVRATVVRAHAAQPAWAALPPKERCRALARFRDLMVDRADALATLISQETGKPRVEALGHEILSVADLITWLVQRGPRVLRPRRVGLRWFKHKKSLVFYRPRGVVGVIAPWNTPFHVAMRDAMTALAAGNAVVVKPSEVTPLCLLAAKDIWDTTGLSRDLFQVVTGAGPTGAALIDAGIQKLNFTGAVSTGRKIAAACGERLVPCTLELGGKAPVVVCDDADIERAARAVVWGGFANNGQLCVGVERVYVTSANYDRLVARVADLVRGLRQGDPASNDVDLGAVTFARQIDNAERLVEDARQKGARVLTGGRRVPRAGQFYEPTVLADCTHQMLVMQEEIFGPVVPIMRVENEAQALDLANGSHLGLAAYVFSRDRRHALAYAQQVSAGAVMVNDVLAHAAFAEAPFGGVKESGYGRVQGEEGLREMCDTVHVNIDRISLWKSEPFWFAYGGKKYHDLLRALPMLFGRRGVLSRIARWF
jgi:succinate-semialdehyde dehydrogenase/glutarate-semialdehyde dehydrogenase